MRSPPRTAAVAGLTLVAALAALPSNAAAISRKQANKAALKALKPQKANTGVVLFGLPKPLKAGSAVFEALPKTAAGAADPQKAKLLRRAAWLFWLDRQYGARFQHPSTMLLVDDRTGKPFGRANLKSWPEVNGRDPAFIGKGYDDKRFQVYAPKPPSGPAVKEVAPPAVAFDRVLRPPLANAAASVIPRGDFAQDCIVMVGLTEDPQFKNDFGAMRVVAERMGIRVFQPPDHFTPGTRFKEGADGADLNAEVDRVIKDENCKDVMIYIDGHGFETGPTGVITGHHWVKRGRPHNGIQNYEGHARVVSAEDVGGILAEHRDTTFKLKIDACFSGRFILDVPLDQNPNLLITETSSQANKVSWSYLKRATVKDGEYVDPGTPGSQSWISRTNNPGNTNPANGIGEFTNGNLTGMQIFAQTQAEVDNARAAGGSLLARMLLRSAELGRPWDFAQAVGLTESKVVEQINRPQTNPPPPPPPPPTTCTSLTASLTTYMGQLHAQLFGDCKNLLPDLDHIRVDVPAGKQINAFDAHSPSCTPDLTGGPSTYIQCKVKADGRICIIVYLQPPAAAGDVLHVSLRRADDSVISEADYTLAAGEQPPCQVTD